MKRRYLLLAIIVVHIALFFGLFFGGNTDNFMEADKFMDYVTSDVALAMQVSSILVLIINCLLVIPIAVFVLWRDEDEAIKQAFEYIAILCAIAVCVTDIICFAILLRGIGNLQSSLEEILKSADISLDQLISGLGSVLVSPISEFSEDAFVEIRSYPIALLVMNILGAGAFGAYGITLYKNFGWTSLRRLSKLEFNGKYYIEK